MGFFNTFGVAPDKAMAADDLEKSMGEMEPLPEGVYQAILDDVEDPTSKRNGIELKFKIVAGSESGKVVKDVLWMPKGDPEKDAYTQRRAQLFASRLGWLVKDAAGKHVEAPGKTSFTDCIGAAVFIDVIHEVEQYEKNGVKKSIKKAKLTFAGLLKPDDPKVQGVATAQGATIAAASAGARANAATKPRPATNEQFKGRI